MLVSGTEHIPGSPKVSPEKICDYACCCDNNDCVKHKFVLATKGSRSSIRPRHRIYRSGRRYSRRLRANRVSVGSMWIYLASDGNHGSAVAGPRGKKDRRQHKARQRAKTHRLCAGNCSFFCSFLQREWHGREL